MTTTLSTLCPICGEGHLHAQVSANEVKYKGHTGSVALHYSICDACESEQAGGVEMRLNKREVMAFRKQIDGLLSGLEIRALRDRLGINQAEAAKIFGGGPVAFSKYENDDVAQSEPMDKLLRAADAVPATFEWLASFASEPEIARHAQIRRFEQWRASVMKLVMPVPSFDRPTIRASQAATVTLHASANDHCFGELLGVGG